MDWIPFALASAVFSAANSLIDRHVMKDSKDPQAFCLFINLVGTLLFAIVYWRLGLTLTTDPISIGVGIFAGVFYFALTLLNFYTDAHADATLKRPVVRTRVAVTLAISALFLGEVLTPAKIVALVLILLGGFYATTKKGQSLRSILSNRMTGLLFFTAICFGIISPIDQMGGKLLGAVPFSLAAYAIPAVLTAVTTPNAKKRVDALVKSKGKALTLKAVIEPVSFITLILAYLNGPAGQIALFREISLPLAFLGGVFILKEHENLKRRGMGTVIVLAGALLAALA